MTPAPSLEVVAPTRNAVGESPLWHAGEGAVGRVCLNDGRHIKQPSLLVLFSR